MRIKIEVGNFQDFLRFSMYVNEFQKGPTGSFEENGFSLERRSEGIPEIAL